MHAVPNTPHSHGLICPVSTSPQRQAFGSSMRAPGSSNSRSASKAANAFRTRRALAGEHPRPRHSKSSRGSIVSAIAATARSFPSRRTTRVYWFSTSQRPSTSWRRSIAIDCSRSTGSKAETTTDGRPLGMNR